MDLYEVIDQVAVLLQKRGRLAYPALQYQFQLDEAGLAALKAELIDGQRVAVDEDGKVLVWAGDGQAASASPTSAFNRQSELLDTQRNCVAGRW